MATARPSMKEAILQAQKELQTFIDLLEPHKLETLQLQTGASFYRLNLRENKDFHLEKSKQPVQELVFCFPLKMRQNYQSMNSGIHNLEGHYFILTSDNSPSTWRLPETVLDAQRRFFLARQFSKLLLKVKGGEEMAYIRPKTERRIWEFHQEYDASEELFYQRVRPLLASRIFDGSESKDTGKPIRLVGLGCGDGRDIQAFLKQFGSRVKEIIGMDVCDKSIGLAQQELKNHKTITTLIQGNCSQLIKHVPEKKAAEILTIGIAVGFLTKQTVVGTREALIICQQAFRRFDILGITGLSEPQLTLEIGKAMGWTPKLKNFCLEETVSLMHFCMYLLHKPLIPNAEERYYAQGNLFDLSMAADPIGILKCLSDSIKNSIERIDLSFAYIREEEIEELARQLRALPQLKQIIHDSDDKMDALKRMVKLQYVSLKRCGAFPQELPPYTLARELFITNNWQNLPVLVKKEESLTECKSSHFGADHKEQALALYAAAISKHKAKSFEEAIKIFNQSIVLFSLSSQYDLIKAKAYLALASSYRDNKQNKEAKECLDKCVDIYNQKNLTKESPEMLAVQEKMKTIPEVKDLEKKI